MPPATPLFFTLMKYKRFIALMAASLLSFAACNKVSSVSDENDSDDTSSSNINDTNDDSDSIAEESDSSSSAQLKFDAVDILFVVDNSSSMEEEQEMLGTAVFSLVNTLTNPLPSSRAPIADDIRIAVTTSDMGVSFNGTPYNAVFTPHAACVGIGNNGAFITDYLTEEIDIYEGMIPCDESNAQCPTGWTCDNLNTNGEGRCFDSTSDGTAQSCPASLTELGSTYLNSQEATHTNLAFTTACLSNVGLDGCAFEQQLAAAAAGLRHDISFVRPDSLTVVIVISDEDDCSLKSSDWHTVDELYSMERNLTCGRHLDLLHDVNEIKTQIDTAKAKVSSNENAILFAAIIGVPTIDECQGSGNNISECLSVYLEHGGTVGDPNTIQRLDPNGNLSPYYEYACVRAQNGIPVTSAYPGSRYVELAQLYGEMGYIFSLCNEDWTPAMVNIAEMIVQNLD